MDLDVKKTKFLMIKNCWSIAELTKKSKLSNSTLYKILRGENHASAKTIGKISKALGVNPSEIIKGEE